MWRNIRGFGLSYHYDVILCPEEGVLSLIFSRATDVIQAFRITINIFVRKTVFFPLLFSVCVVIILKRALLKFKWRLNQYFDVIS